MIQKALIALVLLVIGSQSFAQFKNKDWYISPKISFADYSDRHDWEGYSISKIPPVSVAVERGVTDFLSVGALVGFNNEKYVNDTLSSNVHKYSDFAIGALANVHFAGWIEEWSNYSIFLGDWDIYAGMSVLMKWSKTDEQNMWQEDLQAFTNNEASSFKTVVRPLVGVRYFLNDNVTMLLEVGNGNLGIVTTGISLRIPHAY